MLGNNPKLSKQDIPLLAEYELIIFDRFRFRQINNNTWNAIKAVSSNTKIYLYQAGPEVGANTDSHSIYYLNNLGRFNVSRDSSDGSINKDHPDWFLKNIFGNRVSVVSNNPSYYYLDFGNAKFVDYWIKHTLEDISFQDWRADGIYIDNALACQQSKLRNMMGYTPVKYLDCGNWDKSMNEYLARASSAFHKKNQLIAANRGHSRYATGTESWLKLDKVKSPIDFLIEEGAFAANWGDGDVLFLPVEEWKRQIDLPASIKRSAVGMISHTDLEPNETGLSLKGEKVSYDQIQRFAVASYLLARNMSGPATYFTFVGNMGVDGYKKLIPTEMYRKFDIGVPIASYEKLQGKDLYSRKYSDGYVFVNPTSKKITNAKFPPGFRPRVENKNIRRVGTSWVFDLESHDAVIVRSPANVTVPAPPKFELQ